MSDAAVSGALDFAAAAIFAIAVLHTFMASKFERLAHLQPRHAGLWHLLGEVEAVFGFWAGILLVVMALKVGTADALTYLESRNFTEPAFVFVILVIAASRPIIDFASALLNLVARLMPLEQPLAYYITLLSFGSLLGSLITEPAAMTLVALLLRERYFRGGEPKSFMYATVGVLFVNISIGGTMTHFAAPPILMVAERWGWDTPTIFTLFGWKSAIAVFVNAAGVAYLFRHHLRRQSIQASAATLEVPGWMIGIHLLFLIGVVIFAHHPLVFIAFFLFFLGFTEAYKKYQSKLMLREGLMVAFFLGGLVVLGGQQKWWLQPLLSDLNSAALYVGATLLTAVTDNAALTYLGSLVDGVGDEFKYSLVAGAVTGGGLTVIANAPNPAGFTILKGCFEDGTINAAHLALAATPPTLVAVAAFQLLPG